MTITFNPTVTQAGQAAAVSAANNGLQLAITAISFGTGNYAPVGNETALQAQTKQITIGAGALVNPNQIRMSAVWHSDTDNYPIYEVGFWAGSTLFAVWSAGGSPNGPLGYKTPGVDFVLFNDLYFSQLPPGSVTVTVDGGQSQFLAALTAHEVANNAHPQYQLIADLVDAQAGIWCGLAAGTANNLILTLPASQTLVTGYAQGQRLVFKAALDNTGPMTAQMKLPNGTILAAQSVTKTGTTALNAGDVKNQSVYELFFDGINGAQYQLSGGAGGGAARSVFEYVVSAAQATANATAPLSFSASYIVGLLDVQLQGRTLSSADFTATDGANVTFPAGTFKGGEAVRIIGWSAFNIANAAQFRAIAEVTATSNGQTSFAVQYTPGMIDVRLNGVDLGLADYTATDGATIVIADPTRIGAGDLIQVAIYKPFSVANAVDLTSSQTITGPKNFQNLQAGGNQMPTGGGFTFRNLLINATGAINQRGYTSGTATTAPNQYAIDRWKVAVSGQNLSWTANGAGNTFTAPAGGVSQIIEGANILGGTYVLSWTGTATATVNGAAVTNGGTVTLPANTNATVTFAGGTFAFPQLELGTLPTAFELRSINAEALLCARYFQKYVHGNEQLVVSYLITTAGHTQSVPYPFGQMRTTPTATKVSGGSQTVLTYGSSVIGSTSSTAPSALSSTAWLWTFAGSSYSSSGNGVALTASSAVVAFDADL